MIVGIGLVLYDMLLRIWLYVRLMFGCLILVVSVVYGFVMK